MLRPAHTAILALALAATTTSAQELPTPREIAAAADAAVVVIHGLRDGEPVALGSGFFVREDGLLVTNLHVVEDAEQLQIELASGEIYDRVYVKATDTRRDLIVLKVPASGLPTLPVGDDRAMEVGDVVYAFGHPLGMERTFSDGIVSAKRTLDGVAMLQITAPISRGSSGGPILNHSGEVVGVATLVAREGQNLNLAVPARYARDLATVPDEPRRFEEVAASWRPQTRDGAVARGEGEASAGELYESLEPWEREVVDQMLDVMVLADSAGYEPTDAFAMGSLEERDTRWETFELDAGTYLGVAVCDNDCSDIDLEAFIRGDLVAIDEEPDALPILEVDLPEAAAVTTVVSMYACTTEPCVWAVQWFRRR